MLSHDDPAALKAVLFATARKLLARLGGRPGTVYLEISDRNTSKVHLTSDDACEGQLRSAPGWPEADLADPASLLALLAGGF